MASPRPNGAPKPSHLHPWPPERRRAGAVPPLSAGACGAVVSDLLPANQGHPEVRLSPLSLFPNFPLAAGAEPRWKRRRQTLPCSQFVQGPRVKRNESSGVRVKNDMNTIESKSVKFENA